MRLPLVLSPMVDVTDAAFRSIAQESGADVTCSEMVAAAGIVHDNPSTWRLVEPWPGEKPYGVQIMGGQADEVATAVDAVAARIRPDFIDLNLGCPSPNILRSCAGGFLLKDPVHAGRVIAAAVVAAEAHGVPVTVKMRTGMDEHHLSYLDVGLEAQAAGATRITLHGRTVAQGYQGKADWDAIRRLVEAMEIPVIGNGDLRGPEDVVRMRDETGCAGFFIARAAMRDPTVFTRMRAALDGDLPLPEPPLEARLQTLATYLRRARSLGLPLHHLKRQAVRFCANAPGAKALRARFSDAPDEAALLQIAEAPQTSQAQAPQTQAPQTQAPSAPEPP